MQEAARVRAGDTACLYWASMDARRQWMWLPAFVAETAATTLARGAWQLDPDRSTVSFSVPFW